jgi:crotonobetainyl-CoA:carnitine CoA-transferase CaiB-like acyl-CoA transferase
MLMGDMGAEIIKVERPKTGDDTRRYAPPYIQKKKGVNSEVAAYFTSCNRNKQSVALNFTKPEGQEIIKHLLMESDVVIENFKTGTLDKYGLGYKQLAEEFPRLIYCSITGFGHTGPYKERPAYDMLIQAMGGSMSITGVPDGEPMKMGLSMFDLCSGLHGVIGILAALQERHVSGLGQHVDISMLDVAVALLQNQGMNFLAKKERQARVGNNHPNVVPYQVMPTKDGHFILTASNDDQFTKFCQVAGREELMEDEKFNTMKARVVNRPVVTPALNDITKTQTTEWWLERLEEKGVGCAPILHLDEVFSDPHVLSRGMLIEMLVPGCEEPASLIGSPMKFSRTKVNYRIPPIPLGSHTERVLRANGYTPEECESLRASGIVDYVPGVADGPDEVVTATEVRAERRREDRARKRGKNWGRIASVSVPQVDGYDDTESQALEVARRRL